MTPPISRANQPRRHHYVPQMLLDNFVDDDGWLHWSFTNRGHPNIMRGRPTTVFFESHLYSKIADDGSKDPSTETDFLQALESATAPIVRALILAARTSTSIELTIQQRTLWSAFVLTQWRRTPDRQQTVVPDAEAIETLTQIIDDVILSAPHRAQEIQHLYGDDAKHRLIRDARIDGLRRFNPNIMRVLNSRGLTVLRISKPGRSFVIGSNPVAKLTSEGRTELSDLGSQLWLPVASDVAIGVGDGTGRIVLAETSEERPVRQLNQAVAGQSSAIAARNPTLIASVLRRR